MKFKDLIKGFSKPKTVLNFEENPARTFPDWLKQEMKIRGYTPFEMAYQTKLDAAVIVELLNGKQLPDKDTSLAIARAFRFHPDYVLRVAGILPPITPTKEKLIYCIKNLPDDEIESVIAFIKQRQGSRTEKL